MRSVALTRIGLANSMPTLLLAAGCVSPYHMEPAMPVASHCPDERVLRSDEHPLDPTGLRWYRAAERRDRDLAAQWCATVGEPVVLLDPTPPVAEWSLGEAVTILSWNTWVGGGDLYKMVQEELGLDCTTQVALATHTEPFVLLLQEVSRRSDDLPDARPGRIIPKTIDPVRTAGERPDIVEAARRCGLALVYVPSARNGPDSGSRPGEDKGNAILSNLPLIDPIAIDLPFEGGRKVAVSATVSISDGPRLRVVTAHLDVASTLVRTVLSGNQTRVRQALGLVDGLARAEVDDCTLIEATVVGADLNTWAGNEATLKRMRMAFPQSPEWDGLGTRGSFPTDHILFRSTSTSGFRLEAYERVADTYSSDHNPRRVSVRYKRVE